MKKSVFAKKQALEALILAAGRGRRLMPHTTHVPKCLVKVGGKPILWYQLQSLLRAHITKVTVVVGYCGKQIKEYARKNFPELSLRFVTNTEFYRTNDIVSFLKAGRFADKDFVQIDGDVLFHPGILFSLLRASKLTSAACVRKEKCGKEEMKIYTDKKGRIVRMGKGLDPKRAFGEFIGISRFRKNFSRALYQDMEKLVVREGPQVYSGDAMDHVLIKNKLPLRAVCIPQNSAIEIDFPNDLKRAHYEILPKIVQEFT